MRIDVLTIFPSLFDSFLNESLLKKAIEKGIVDVRVHDLREYSCNKHKKVDDAPFGGGAGMVMTPQPIADAINALKGEALKKEGRSKTVLLDPGGKRFDQKLAKELSTFDRLILICGRYEGVDERIAENFADEVISIGDFILSGGEVAAMAVTEAVFRLLPGAIGNVESLEDESFERGFLEYPQYTRPEDFRGFKAPEVLLSGHHENIEKWRRQKALEKTARIRPDLLPDIAADIKFSIALVHYPVAGKSGNEMTSSVTTIDVHDLARIGKTFGAKTVYIVTPIEDQQRLVERIRMHWATEERLQQTDARRAAALDTIKVVSSMDEIIEGAKGKRIKLLATSATAMENAVSPAEWRKIAAHNPADEWVIVFGTAYGLGKSLVEKADSRLLPITGASEFNHLPVRAASAIILNSLIGRSKEKQ